MHFVREEARGLARDLLRAVPCGGRVNVVIAPPFTSLAAVHEEINGTHIELAAQNVCWETHGEFTGEVSAPMLLDCGCKWVIVGHSERRGIFHETDWMIARKLKTCLEFGLTPILCIGETREERVEGLTERVLQSQVLSALEGIKLSTEETIAIAYEPVWAIGTGKTTTREDLLHIRGFLNTTLSHLFGNLSFGIRFLYGGSVNEDNINYLLGSSAIDGVLVGGASIRAESFIKIIKAAEEN